jgi:transposase
MNRSFSFGIQEAVAMQAYSMDLRERVMADVEAGLGTEATARKYRVSASWVRKLKRQRREVGHFAPLSPRVSHESKLDPHLEQLDGFVQQKPDATLNELQAQLRAQGAAAGRVTVWRALKKLGLTFKKKSCARPSNGGLTCRSGG